MISASDFQRLIEAYGADPQRWPATRRADADAFLAAEPDQAAAMLAGERALDEALDVLRPPVVSPTLRDRILAAAPKPQQAGWSVFAGWLRPGVGALMAASCAAGVVAGLLLIAPPERPETGADVVASLTGAQDAVGSDDEGEVS
jgi:hypothetical protein